MKNIILALCIVFVAGLAFAEPVDLKVIDKFDLEFHEGFIVSLREEGIENVLTTTLLRYPSQVGRFDLDVGGCPSIREPIIALSYHLGDLSQFGLETPFSKYIDLSIGGYVGFEFNRYKNDIDQDDEWEDGLDGGIFCKALSVKF